MSSLNKYFRVFPWTYSMW